MGLVRICFMAVACLNGSGAVGVVVVPCVGMRLTMDNETSDDGNRHSEDEWACYSIRWGGWRRIDDRHCHGLMDIVTNQAVLLCTMNHSLPIIHTTNDILTATSNKRRDDNRRENSSCSCTVYTSKD